MSLELIKMVKREKSVALLAPSFAIDFPYPAIIGMLRELGFDEVTELTYGARIVNQHYLEYAKSHLDQPYFITSPCPTTVTLIQVKYPDLIKYLVPVVSPMVAMAKFYRSLHPDYKIIFISPCFAKQKIEAPKYPECIDGVITYSELKEIFDESGIKAEDFNRKYFFDSLIQEYTKIYPVSGGLASTSKIQKLFKKDELLVTDGVANLVKALDEIRSGKSQYRFFDFLNCPGGCIGGPAIIHKEIPTEQRKAMIHEYMVASSKHVLGRHRGIIECSAELDFSAKF